MTQNAILDSLSLAAVMNTVLDGLVIIDNVGIICAFNPAAVRIFGYAPQEVIGQNVKILMPEPYKAEHDGYLENYHQTHNPKIIGIGREVSGRRKNGEVFPMELGVNEIHSDNLLMFVGTVRDISERKKAEKEKELWIKDLTRSNQELDDFAHIASHDLKEPLRGLAYNARFLKEDYETILDADAVKRFERIIYLCRRMEQLIDDLLHFSRIGQQGLAVRETDVNLVVQDTIAILQGVIQMDNVYINIPNPLPIITCDSVRIAEVFRNLMVNGIKYNNNKEKRIEIGFNDGIFYVKDNGIGIEKNFHEDIFRIFKRLNTEDESNKGTGVGLTFVKKIIERHGGDIWLESIPNKGTTFYFALK